MTKNTYIFDATLANFNQLVIEGSFNKPVLIDFWASWCEPCKTLTPLLEKIVETYQGELLLVKVDCDAEQEVVGQFGVRSLPTVVLFKEGQPIDGFTGNQPESAIKEMLNKHLSIPAVSGEIDKFKQAESIYQQGSTAEAEVLLKELLAEDNSNIPALILYARCLAEKGILEEAETILNSITGDEYKQPLAMAKTQLAFLNEAASLPSEEDLITRLKEFPDNEQAMYQLAIVQLANQRYEQALEGLFKLFQQHRNYQNGLPQQTLVKLFELLGNENALVTTYRKKLYQALY